MSSLSRIDMDISGRSKEIPEVALRNSWRGKMKLKNNADPLSELWELWKDIETKWEEKNVEGKSRSNKPCAVNKQLPA